MPNVPVAKRKALTDPLQTGGVAAPSTDLSGSIERVTAAGTDVIKGLDKQRQEVDSAVVTARENALRRRKVELETERLDFRGVDAAQSLDVLTPKWKASVEELSEGLTDRQKALFAARADHLYSGAGQFFEGSHQYMNKEIENYKTDTHNSSLDIRVDDAISNYDDPIRLQQEFDGIEALIRDKHGDSQIAKDKINEVTELIEKGHEERELERKKVEAEELEAANLEANNDLEESLLEESLTYKEVKAREDVLGKDYGKWLRELEKQQKRKEKIAKGGAIKDDPNLYADLQVEMLQAETPEQFEEAKKKVVEAVGNGQILPKTSNSLITAGQKNIQLNEVQKTQKNTVILHLKNAFNEGLLGEDLEGQVEYNKQVASLTRWTADNPDKDPIEWWQIISDTYNRSFMTNVLTTFFPSGVEAPKEKTQQSQREDLDTAIRLLKEEGLPRTTKNIEYVMEQL